MPIKTRPFSAGVNLELLHLKMGVTVSEPCDVIRGPFQHHSRSDIVHLHMRIVKIKRVGESARILPILVKEGVKRGKSTSFFSFS